MSGFERETERPGLAVEPATLLEKNSSWQWGRPFGRAPREICPVISIHTHWGGDCTTTMRWQDAGAAIL